MLNKPQTQNAGEGTAAIQAGGSADNASIYQTNNYGLTVEEVRTVAKDTFRSDFVQLLGQAGDIAEARANRVIERYLERLENENPAGLAEASTPDFRYALFTAQKAQARSGDENLGELLVELLIERSREGQRTLQQIVLNEALEAASRITDEQVAALTVSFAIRRVVKSLFILPDFFLMMDAHVAPYVSKAKLSDASFSHLAYTGCGVVEMGETSLSEAFHQFYPGIWQLGFSPEDQIFKQLDGRSLQLVRPSQHTPQMFEVVGGSVGIAEKLQESMVQDAHQRSLLTQLMTRSNLSPEQMKARCIAERPYMADLFDLWDNTSMEKFNPSSVGIAIAHANLARSIPDLPPLSVWIN